MKEALMICKDFLPPAVLAQYPSCPMPSSFFPAFRKTLFPPRIPVNNPSTSDCTCAKSLQLCQTVCNSVDCSPSGSSVHRTLQARILKWLAISFYRGSSWNSGMELRPLHWQADSLPLRHHGNPNQKNKCHFSAAFLTPCPIPSSSPFKHIQGTK